MIYFPTKSTKILLIILCAIVTFHICLLSSKRISVNYVYLSSNNISETQYELFLSSLDIIDQAKFINKTKTEYMFNLPEKTFQYLYWSYFAIIALLIILVKTQIKDSENEKS